MNGHPTTLAFDPADFAEYPHTKQTWPRGTMFRYRARVRGTGPQYLIDAKPYDASGPADWQLSTPEQERTITIAELAERYVERDVWCCDSSLVTELFRTDFFSYDDITNLRPDPSKWDAEECRDWVREHMSEDDLPDRRMLDCETCSGTGEVDSDATDAPPTIPCTVCNGTGSSNTPDPDEDEDDDYLDTIRDLIHRNADDAEIMEWWRVSDWMARQLIQAGEAVLDNEYGWWWGRQGTGQGMLMDGIFQRIAGWYVKGEGGE